MKLRVHPPGSGAFLDEPRPVGAMGQDDRIVIRRLPVAPAIKMHRTTGFGRFRSLSPGPGWAIRPKQIAGIARSCQGHARGRSSMGTNR